MAEMPRLDSNVSCDAFESEQNTRKFSISDHMNAFQLSPEKSDSFVIDMDAFPSGISKDSNTNSRITKSLSRKGSQRGSDKKVSGNTIHDKDTVPTGCSPKGSSKAEKPVVAVGSIVDHSPNSQVHHQITITAAGNISTVNTPCESKSVGRRNGFRRTWWAVDPKRVLLFFATLSSMGTMLLIYFTLTISKQNAEEYGADWQQ